MGETPPDDPRDHGHRFLEALVWSPGSDVQQIGVALVHCPYRMEMGCIDAWWGHMYESWVEPQVPDAFIGREAGMGHYGRGLSDPGSDPEPPPTITLEHRVGSRQRD